MKQEKKINVFLFQKVLLLLGEPILLGDYSPLSCILDACGKPYGILKL